MGYGTSYGSDIAVIKMPKSCNQQPLDFYKGELYDGQEIVAVGFPQLGDKPSWQMTKGSIANAALEDEKLFNDTLSCIQHTAAIDPGSSGGPLLIKNQDKYQIAGINTWKAFYRDGVNISIPANTISSILQNNILTHTEQNYIKNIKYTGATWQKMYNELTDEDKLYIKNAKTLLPLELVDITVEKLKNKFGDKFKNKFTYDRTTNKEIYEGKGGVENDLDHNILIAFDYISYLSKANMLFSLSLEYDIFGLGIVGGHLDVMSHYVNFTKITNIPNIGTYTESRQSTDLRSFLGGLFLGVQVPIRINSSHLLFPRTIAGFGIGTIFTKKIKSTSDIFNVSFFSSIYFRPGLQYRYVMRNCSFVLNLYYDMNNIWNKDVEIATTKSVKHKKGNRYMQHGIGLGVGVAF